MRMQLLCTGIVQTNAAETRTAKPQFYLSTYIKAHQPTHHAACHLRRSLTSMQSSAIVLHARSAVHKLAITSYLRPDAPIDELVLEASDGDVALLKLGCTAPEHNPVSLACSRCPKPPLSYLSPVSDKERSSPAAV